MSSAQVLQLLSELVAFEEHGSRQGTGAAENLHPSQLHLVDADDGGLQLRLLLLEQAADVVDLRRWKQGRHMSWQMVCENRCVKVWTPYTGSR